MKKLVLPLILLAASAHAQTSLSDQISAVDSAQTEIEAKEQASRIAEEKRAANKLKKQHEEKLADKKREQEYEDQLRSLQLQALKTRVDRQNDYIDQELKAREAVTNVIQSQANSENNLSQGAKTLMEKEGEARVKKNSGWGN